MTSRSRRSRRRSTRSDDRLAVAADDPLDSGYTLLAGCKPIGLAMDAPQTVALAVADGTGHARLHWTVPLSFGGTKVRLQAFEADACAVSNVVHADP